MALRETWQSIKRRFGKPRPAPSVIMTEYGPVTEKYRLLAALNMKADRAKRDAAVDAVGEDEARRRYPEGWE